MELNYYILLIAALIPLIMGFIWYNPKVFGTAWMNSTGLTEEKMKGANMPLIFFLSYVFSILIASVIMQMSIHQFGVLSTLGGSELDESSTQYFADFMAKYGTNFRTFKHGVLHGVLAGFFFAMPVIATNAMFERKGFKNILINSGYWIVTLGLMGGVICAYM
ncbi:MAG: hypothetical protein COA67_07625 [Lutibacter sp.]|nr:MAG: hypothetical protein COA67_07625 [Lutibacter sp.]